MLLNNFNVIYRTIFNSIDNPSLKNDDVKHLIDSDCALTYSPNFFCIINSKDFSFDYISKNMIARLGLSDFELQKGGLISIWNRIHPQDINCLLDSLDELGRFINKQSSIGNHQLSFSWNYRFRKGNGSYCNVIQNTTPFYFNDKNKKKGLTHFTIINSQFKMPIKASVNLLSPNGNFKTIYTDNCSQSTFYKNISKREKDVIKLLVKEKTSKSIGKRLFISSNTVDTHRRNILKKLKLSSTGELINILKKQQNIF